jgi:hypothetical protein
MPLQLCVEEGGVGGEEINTATWSSSSVARMRATISLIQIAERQLLQALALPCRRHLFFNLMAGVPRRRRSYSLSMTLRDDSIPVA